MLTAANCLGFFLAAIERWAEAGRWTACALDLMRHHRVSREQEVGALASLSRARLGLGDPAQDRALADEAAVVLGQAREHRALVLPYVALARTLCAEQGQLTRAAIEEALRAAETSVAASSACGWEPLIPEAYAELARASGGAPAQAHHLREVHRLCTAIGATGHARRGEASHR